LQQLIGYNVVTAVFISLLATFFCLQCFDAVGWAAGRASGLKKNEWWDVGVVVWDEVQTSI